MNGIYIHIPFCRKKCSYCDFVSYVGMENCADAYIDALIREMLQFEGERADTIFVGGGTPSVLSGAQIKRLGGALFDYFDIAENFEFTMEANPDTVNDEKILAMLEAGVNRVSVGVQSFNDRELREIGRIHDAKTAQNAILLLHKGGFRNISLDLMTALPYQTMESLKLNLKTAAELPVTHISAYSLIIEDKTPLWQQYTEGDLVLPSEDEEREMYAYAVDYLAANGFNQYEISNFAKEGYECRHNIKYWTMQPYIGLGAAAHSFNGDCRSYNTNDVCRYVKGEKSSVVRLTEQDKISEFIITGLRMTCGINVSEFESLFGRSIDVLYSNELNKFINLGLIRKTENGYCLTPRGIDVSNSVLCEFV